jgi:hypothetical protein
MSVPPAQPKIYHITHVDNLPAILAGGGLVSDAEMIRRGGPAAAIGMSSIKKRRVEELTVDCHPGARVGDFVPFYFCPRSIMLYLIYMGNHPELAYRGGQGPILHLEADLYQTIAWANANGHRWAFSLSNAGAYYAPFSSKVEELDQINWESVAATDFRPAHIKEGKQAEFLLHGRFPWHLVARIGVPSRAIQEQVWAALNAATHKPPVETRPEWYY